MQDLEKQLTSTKQQLHQLRSGVMKSDNAMDIDFDFSGQPVLKLPDVGHRPPRRNRPPVPQDLSGARSSIRNYGRGVIKVPPPYRQAASSNIIAENAPALPPKPVADRLLGQYHACVHSVLPIIHWPSFTAEYEQVYQAGTLRGARREWTAVLFGVFACGAMHTLEPNKEQESRGYLLASQSVADTWLDDFTLDQARVTLLASIALYEMNSRSASWVWLGTAVRIAQDIGLHMESGPWPAVEAEMRKRLWWGIYAWDRYVYCAQTSGGEYKFLTRTGYCLWNWANPSRSMTRIVMLTSRAPLTSSSYLKPRACRKDRKRILCSPLSMWFAPLAN